MLPLMAEPVPGLPEPVNDALAFPLPAETTTVEAAGIPFFVRSWGEAGATPLLLLHGVTSSSLGWWRVGPALAAAGFRVHAPDMPGHGRTGSWRGHWRFHDNARDLVALVEALASPGTSSASSATRGERDRGGVPCCRSRARETRRRRSTGPAA